MAGIPTTSELAGAAGISKSYASEIVNGKRQPARSLAIHILRKTGWRHATIADLTETQLATLESIEPWSPRATRCSQHVTAADIETCGRHCPMRAGLMQEAA